MAERFYYLYLKDALKERGMSKAGIHQVEEKLPVAKKEDRQVVTTSVFSFLKWEQRQSGYIDITPDHIRPRFVALGFSSLGIEQFYNDQAMTLALDREALLNVLTAYFVRNEGMVPAGFRSDMKAMWRAAEIERHGES